MHSLFDFFNGDYVKGLDTLVDNLRLINLLQNILGFLLILIFCIGNTWIFTEWFDFQIFRSNQKFSDIWQEPAKKLGVLVCGAYCALSTLFIYVVNILSSIRAELSLRMNISSSSTEKADEFSQLNVMASKIEDKFQGSQLTIKCLIALFSLCAAVALLISI